MSSLEVTLLAVFSENPHFLISNKLVTVVCTELVDGFASIVCL